MLYLLLQIWIWILAAGLLGLFFGWLVWGRRGSAHQGNAAEVIRLERELAECRSRCRELEAADSGPAGPETGSEPDKRHGA